MAELVALRAAIVRIGFNVNLANTVIEQGGFETMRDLALLPKKDGISKLCNTIRKVPTGVGNPPILLPAVLERRLLAMQNWVMKKQALGQDLVPATFTMEKANQIVQFVLPAEEDESSQVKAPEAFKTATKWRMFIESFDNHLSTVKGKSGLPLNYVIRTTEVPEPGAVYASDHESLVMTAPLAGATFKEDNAIVWAKTKELTLEGPAWNYSQPFEKARDGRGAIQAIRSHYEGPSTMNRETNEANETLSELTYTGEKRTFTFERFVSLRQEAHRVLDEAGEPVGEARKVRELLRGIHSDTMMPAIAMVKATPNMLNDFDTTVNYLAQFVAAGKVKSPPRNVSGFEQRSPAGRGGGRGGRGRGGRGRGRGGGRGDRSPSKADDRNYTSQEWSELSVDQREKIKALRAAKKDKAKTSNTSATNSQADEPEEEQPTNQAGNSFGRNKKARQE